MKILEVVKHFQKYFFKIHNIIIHVHFQNVRSRLLKMALLKYFKRIEPSKEERIQSVLPKSDGPLVHLMPSSAIEVANSVVSEFLPTMTLRDEPILPAKFLEK